MYLDFFALRKLPFRQRPDAEFLYLDAAYSAARAELTQALQRQDAITILCGEAGVGKTTLLESALSEHGDQRPLIRINQPDVSAAELTQAIAYQLGGGADSDDSGCDIDELLAALPAGTPRPLLIVDHTHCFPAPTLRTLLQLTLRSDRLGVLLLGRASGTAAPAWATAGGLRANTNPVVLLPMTAERVGGYIESRLRAAGGGERSVFTTEAYGVVFRRTRGIPRLINALCDIAMTLACSRSSERVSASELGAAAQDKRWLELQLPEHSSSVVPAAAQMPTLTPVPAEESSHDWSSELPVESTMELRRPLDRLLVLRSGISIAELSLVPGRLRVGRLQSNDLVLEGQFVSRCHCELITVADGLETNTTVVDARSSNGTLVNGQAVHRRWLVDGDEVQVGDYVLRYVSGAAKEGSHEDVAPGPVYRHQELP